MKEYAIQMGRKGASASDPVRFSEPQGRYTSQTQAMLKLRSLEEQMGKKGYHFRLLSREISDWEVCEE